jgi:hypothetical protein
MAFVARTDVHWFASSRLSRRRCRQRECTEISSRTENKQAVRRVYSPIGAEPNRRTDMVIEEEKSIDRRNPLEC